MAKEYIERGAFIKTLKKVKNDCEHGEGVSRNDKL